MAAPNDIVLFHYSFSPYAKRITWYLALRGINYAQCLQPPTLPRPDLTALNIHYRRIPILSISRDVYLDTRLILEKLESRFPSSPLGASTPDQKAIERLLSIWTIDGGIFSRAAQLIPSDMALLKDPKFKRDREDYTGRSWRKEDVESGRAEAMAHIRAAFEFLETGLLSDRREWILKTEKPSLADIEAIWPFHWLIDLKGALPPSLFSPTTYPLVFAWISRFKAAIEAARSSMPKPTTLKGAEAIKHITCADHAELDTELLVDEKDPLGLQKGEEVEVWPTDSGMRHRDRGMLMGLTGREVVLMVRSEVGGKEVRIHAPRTNFRIQRTVSEKGGAKL